MVSGVCESGSHRRQVMSKLIGVPTMYFLAEGIVFPSVGFFLVDFIDGLQTNARSMGFVHSLYLGLIILLGPIATSVAKRFGNRATIATGCFMTAGGLMVTSQVTHIWQIFLSHSFVTGCGLCLLTQGTVYDLARSFNKSASLYIGVMYAGSSVGFIINPLVFSQVRLVYGWRGTILIASAVSMNMLPLVLLLFHQKASKVSNLNQNATTTEDHSGYNEHAGSAGTCESGQDNTVLKHQRDDQSDRMCKLSKNVSEFHTDEKNGAVEVVHHSDCIEYADDTSVCEMDKQDKIGMEHRQNNDISENNTEDHHDEMKQQAPSVLMLFKIPSLVMIATVYFFGRFAYIGFFVHFSASLILRGFSEQDAALVFTSYGLGGLFGKSCCALPGQLDIMSNYNFYMLSMFIIGICFVIFSSLTNLVSLLFCGFVVGFFIGVFVGLFPAITQSCVSKEWFNFAYGYIGIPTGVSSALGGYIMGAVYDVSGVYNTSFYIAGVCFFFNGFLMFASNFFRKCHNQMSGKRIFGNRIAEDVGSHCA